MSAALDRDTRVDTQQDRDAPKAPCADHDRASAHMAAMREILDVIGQSRADARPVFDAVLRNARHLCGASTAALLLGRPEDARLRLVALDYGDATPAAEVEQRIARVNQTQMKMDPKVHVAARAICSGDVVHIADLAQSESYLAGESTFRIMVDEQGQRASLTVPLRDERGPIGALNLHRREPGLFDAQDVDLMRGFAVQAAIAIENMHQFRAVQTRLEHEAATNRILSVISQSRADETPVFQAIHDSVSQLCETPFSGLFLVDPDAGLLRMVTHFGDNPDYIAGTAREWPLGEPTAMARAVSKRQVIHIEDMAATKAYRAGDPATVQAVDQEGIGTFLAVPLLSDGTAIGCIGTYRRSAQPFTPDQIALVQTFADQAVIAIENVHQYREVQDRLRRERASGDVLEVISQSRDDEKPVFDTILENACALCNAPLAGLILGTAEDSFQTLAAHKGMFPQAISLFETGQMQMDGSLSYAARSIIEARLIAFDDMGQSELYEAGSPVVRSMVDASNIRSVLFVPLIKDGVGIGNLTLFRREISAFSASEISLIETFAAQAVIAIQNVRQFKALETLNAELGARVGEQVGEIERMGRLKRFLPAAVADAVVSSGSDKMLSSHRALLGVLFCDIRGFTAFCETAEPEETIEVLQTYHEEMGKLINAHGAGVDHRMGDGIMVLFNDPLPCDDPAGDAVRLAIAMRARMAELGKQWKRLGYRLGFGVGVSLGYATVGMVGFEGRFDYTASGTAINLAARLCDEAEDGEILLSPRAGIAVEDDFGVQTRGELRLKGIREPMEVFRLAGAIT